MHRTRGLGAVFGLCLILSSSVGVAMGGGSTSVAVQPSSDSITAGNASTVDIVVDSAAGGVGSIDVDLSVTDGAIADIADTTVAGNPETVQTSGGTDSVRIIATGMDTADSGAVRIASVTLTGESTGTSDLGLAVSAIGDEAGQAYTISDEVGGELTVEASGDSTPPDTQTETESSSNSESSSSSDSSDSSSSSDSDSDSDTNDEPNTDTPAETDTTTSQPSSTAADQSTASQRNNTSSTATPAVTSTSTRTSSGDTVESSGPSDTLFIVAGSVLAALGGIVVYRRV